jgi:DNA-binding transcriptional LysR family regulator
VDGPDGRRTIRFAPVLQSGNGTLLRHGDRAGHGRGVAAERLISEDLAEGRLELVPTAVIGSGRLIAVYLSRKYLSAKVRTFLDFIAHNARLK